MAFQVSPGVRVTETDLTNIIPAVSTSVGAFVGRFRWGPINEVTTLATESGLVESFGTPIALTRKQALPGSGTTFQNQQDWYAAANFLQYTSALRVVRVAGAGALNASEGVTRAGESEIILDSDQGRLIENLEHFETTPPTGAGMFYTKYAGTYGNNVGIAFVDSGLSDSEYNAAQYLVSDTDTEYRFSDLFDSKPGTSVFAELRIGATVNDEVHVVIFDRTGVITGSVGAVLEQYGYVSKLTDARTADGAPNYFSTVINDQSRWVWVSNDYAYDPDTAVPGAVELTSTDTTTGPGEWGLTSTEVNAFTTTKQFAVLDGTVPVRYNLAGGNDGNDTVVAVGTGGGSGAGRASGWQLFADPEAQADVSIFITGLAGNAVASTDKANKAAIIAIGERRRDIVTVTSPDFTSAVTTPSATAITTYFDTGFASSSYGVFTSGWKYQYDRYNDVFFWMPLDPDVAGLMARTDATNAPWFSPAGLNRGQIRDVVRLSFNPNQADRDDLYQARVNPVVTFPGEGTILYGDKTSLSRPSAFDRINVRRLFIVLEKAIATSARFQLFELNDEFTRASFVNAVEPFLRDVQAQRGIEEFRVIADTSVNTPEVVSGNEFRANIFIRPTYSINFITLNFVAVRGGVSFDEIAGVVA